MKYTMIKIFTTFLLFISLSACSFTNPFSSMLEPFVYRLSIQQGNIIDQDQIDKLKLGMNKKQVTFVLGTPLAKDIFDSDHWEFSYTMMPPRAKTITKKLVVLFKQDKLIKITGDFETDKITSL